MVIALTTFDIDNPQHWTTARVVLAQAEKFPDKTAIEFINGESWTFKDLRQQGLLAAAELKNSGVKSGENVALLIDSPSHFTRYWLGLSFIGATMVAINTSMRGKLLRHQLDLSESHFLITENKYLDESTAVQSAATILPLDKLANGANIPLEITQISQSINSDLSCVMFTSGTSGPSKAVLMPQAHCMLFAVGTIDNYQLQKDDTFYICLPLFHANGLFMQLLACLAVGCKAVIRERFSASEWLSDIRKFNITHTNTLGAVAAFIVAQKPSAEDKNHSLKVIGAAPLPAVVEESFRDRFNVKSVVPLYGMTEVNIPLYGKLDESAPGTCGHIYDKYFEVEIRHPDTDEQVAMGETGEIMVRPKLANGFMSGYAGMPEETLKAWRNFWFHTGDAGYCDHLGRFIFVDRIKDCIRKRGENISSYEVEQAFLDVDDIAEVAAYAVPADGGDGMEDEVMIAVMLKPELSCKSLSVSDCDVDTWINTAARNLPAFALPRYIRVTTSLPKTQTGKIQKVVLRNLGVTADTHDRTKQDRIN